MNVSHFDGHVQTMNYKNVLSLKPHDVWSMEKTTWQHAGKDAQAADFLQ